MQGLAAPVVVQSTSNPGSEMIAFLAALTALRSGDTSVRLPQEWTGIPGKVADAFNQIAELNEQMTQELARFSKVVRSEEHKYEI